MLAVKIYTEHVDMALVTISMLAILLIGISSFLPSLEKGVG